MNTEKHVYVLGKYFGESEITELLSELDVQEKPKLKRGDDTTFLSKPTKGIELTFEDSEALITSAREYPEGALVLSNIRFYGVKTDEFSLFQDKLPFNVNFGDDKNTLISKLGQPVLSNPSGTKMRWDSQAVSMFASLNQSGHLEIFSIQLLAG